MLLTAESTGQGQEHQNQGQKKQLESTSSGCNSGCLAHVDGGMQPAAVADLAIADAPAEEVKEADKDDNTDKADNDDNDDNDDADAEDDAEGSNAESEAEEDLEAVVRYLPLPSPSFWPLIP